MSASLMGQRLVPTAPDYQQSLKALCQRSTTTAPEVEHTVRTIVDDVRKNGDQAVVEYTLRFDRRRPNGHDSFEIDRRDWQSRAASVGGDVRQALERAAAAIREFHARQVEDSYAIDNGAGGYLALKVDPLRRVGIYVPGGTALYPSSVLMTAIPARVAGVDEIIMVTPGASPETLLAAQISGVDRVFEIGGAQAIAALAYGTGTVPRVDKIVGPGNQWVAVAKRIVFGEVDIDSVAGPSEVLIVTDETANPRFVAADLLAQAEHDVEARPLLVATKEEFVDAVEVELERQLASLSRADIARTSLNRYGVAIVAPSIDQALAFIEAYAPEHLELQLANAHEIAQRVRCAGAIFVGSYTPEASGDYVAGPNHVLPTSGAARYASPLGVYDFRKRTSVMSFSREAFAAQVADIVTVASVEGLDAHARSAQIRIDRPTSDPKDSA